MTEGMQPESFHSVTKSGFRDWGEEDNVSHIHGVCAQLDAKSSTWTLPY